MKKRIVLFLVFIVTLVTLFVACQKTSTVPPTTDTQDATDTAPVIPKEEYPIPTQEQLDALTDADWAILDEMTEGVLSPLPKPSRSYKWTRSWTNWKHMGR